MRGKVLTYLGMTLDYTTKKQSKNLHVQIHTQNVELLTDMNGSAKMPAARHLFSVNPEAKQQETAHIFYTW